MPMEWSSSRAEMIQTSRDRLEGDPKHVHINKPMNKKSSQSMMDRQDVSSSKDSLDVYYEGAAGEDEQIRRKDVRISDVMSMDELDEEMITV